MSPFPVAFCYQKPHNHGHIVRDRGGKDRGGISMMDLIFCVLWVKRNRRLRLYQKNWEMGWFPQLSPKIQPFCAFHSHNKSRKAKTYTAAGSAECCPFHLFPPLLSHPRSCFCSLLSPGWWPVWRPHIWGNVSHCFSFFPQQNRNTETNKAGDHPAWDLLLQVFISWVSFCFRAILNSEASSFTRDASSPETSTSSLNQSHSTATWSFKSSLLHL